MNKAEYNSLPNSPVPLQKKRLLSVARNFRDMEERAYKSLSGADVAQAPLFGYTADMLACIARGKAVKATVELFRKKWEAYCVLNNAKVEEAPKIEFGPMAGQSTIHYRWVSPESFRGHESLVKKILTGFDRPPKVKVKT